MQFLMIDHWDGVRGGFFTRHGGVSPSPFDSLNVSYGVGDDAAHVAENRSRVKKRLAVQALVSARQVHGDRLLTIAAPPDADYEVDGYDALLTNQPGVGLLIQQADCQAVVLFDPIRRAVANVHNGWRGSVANIVAKTVQRLAADFGSHPNHLLAAISPSLGPCCAEFVNFHQEFPHDFHGHQVTPAHFDFWAITRRQLQQAGVLARNINTAGICTRCDADYFSYRRAPSTGRSGTVVALTPPAGARFIEPKAAERLYP